MQGVKKQIPRLDGKNCVVLWPLLCSVAAHLQLPCSSTRTSQLECILRAAVRSPFSPCVKQTQRAEELMLSGQPMRKGPGDKFPSLLPWSEYANMCLHSLSEGQGRLNPSFPQWSPACDGPFTGIPPVPVSRTPTALACSGGHLPRGVLHCLHPSPT